MASLLAALLIVESNGDNSAIRFEKHGTSRGALQLKEIFVADFNRISGKHYIPTDAHNLEKAVEMYGVVIAHYCTRERLGHEPTDRDRALCFHYGSRAALTTTDPDGYWPKVLKAMEQAK